MKICDYDSLVKRETRKLASRCFQKIMGMSHALYIVPETIDKGKIVIKTDAIACMAAGYFIWIPN